MILHPHREMCDQRQKNLVGCSGNTLTDWSGVFSSLPVHMLYRKADDVVKTKNSSKI